MSRNYIYVLMTPYEEVQIFKNLSFQDKRTKKGKLNSKIEAELLKLSQMCWENGYTLHELFRGEE